jgi:hypothetical protein
MYSIEFFSGITTIDNRLKRMQVYGNAFTLPERTVNFEDLQYRAYKIPIPTTLDMGQDHSVTVYADVRGDLRKACLDWQAACINPAITQGSFFESNRRPTRIGNGDDNQPSITISLLAPDYQTVVEQTVIYGSRVTKVGGLELSNTAGGISTFTVDFKSVYWEQLGGASAEYNSDANRYFNLGAPNKPWAGSATADTVSSGGTPNPGGDPDWVNAQGSGQGGNVN